MGEGVPRLPMLEGIPSRVRASWFICTAVIKVRAWPHWPHRYATVRGSAVLPDHGRPVLAVAGCRAHTRPGDTPGGPSVLRGEEFVASGCRSVTTDQGRHFESFLFRHLNILTGTTHIRTRAYHPAANGMVERLHRQLKTAIRCHQRRWTEALPLILMGIRSSWKEDLGATAAEMVYGQPLRLSGQFLTLQPTSESLSSAAPFVQQLKAAFEDLRPRSVVRQCDRKCSFSRTWLQLAMCSYVMMVISGLWSNRTAGPIVLYPAVISVSQCTWVVMTNRSLWTDSNPHLSWPMT